MINKLLFATFTEKAKALFGSDDPQPLYVLILFGAIFLLGGVLMIWAIYFRKKKGAYSSKRWNPKNRKTISKKSRHREHRRRNPTLAETRGLPPARPEDSGNHFG